MKTHQAVRVAVVCLVALLAMSSKGYGCVVAISVTPAGPFNFGTGGGSGMLTINTGGTSPGSGISCHWQLTSSPFITASLTSGGGGSSFQFTTNFTASANPDLGTRTGFITVTQKEDSTSQTITVTEQAATGDFSVSASPTSMTANEPSTSNFAVTLTRSGGFAGGVSLSASGLPANTSATFSPNPAFGTSSTMTVTVQSNATPGTYNVIVQGVNGSVSHSATPISFTINPTHVVNTEHVFYIGPELHVHELVWGGGQWFHNDLNAEWGGVGAAAGSKLAGFVFTPSGGSVGMDVFYLGTDQHVHLLQWSNNAWFPSDVNAAAGGAPLAASGSALTGFVFTPTGGTAQMHVFYFGADQHVHELLFTNSWFHNDLTTEWGGALPTTGSSLTGYTFLPSGNGNTNQMHIFYFSANQHMNEMLWFNNQWFTNDLTAEWGGALPVTGSALHGFTFIPSGSSNQMHNFYFGSDQHVHELLQNQGWFPEDITGSWGGSLVGSGSGLAGYTFAPPGDNLQMHVFYLGTDSHINELLWVNNAWFAGDLTLSWGGPSAAPGSALTGFVFTPPGSIAGMHVYSVASDQHVHELAWAPGSWTPYDITSLAGAPNVNPGTSLLGFTF
jgi:Putative binding domain, N-terminal